MAELKPCPFCGSHDAYMMTEQDEDGFGFFLNIKCGTCRAATGQHYVSHGNDCPQARAEVRAAWNRRASPSTAPSGMAQAAGEGQQAVPDEDIAKLRDAHDRMPLVRWTKDRSAVLIPETEDWAAVRVECHANKLISPTVARYIAACNPVVIGKLLASPAVAPSVQPVRMLTRAEVDEIVYQCRQDGDDTTYAIVHAALVSAIGAAPSAQEPQAAEWGAAKLLRQWQQPDYMRLHAGEMSAQEVRAVQAVLAAIERELSAAMQLAQGLREPLRYRWDQDTDDTFGFMVGPVPDGEWVKWNDVLTMFTTAPSASAAPVVTADAVRDVLAERERQQTVEGWIPEHDDEHLDGSMARAAAVYCLCAEGPPKPGTPSELHSSRRWDFNILRAIWPSDWNFKPKDRRSNLIRAGALILAEIERLDRVAMHSTDALEEASSATGTAANQTEGNSHHG